MAPTRARSAAWARRFAIVAALGAVAAVMGAHHPKVPPEAAVAALCLALGLAGLAILCGLWAMCTIWRTGQPGLGRALFGLLLATVTLAYPGYLATRAAQAPLTNAASTSSDEPPPLSRSIRAAAVRGVARAAARGGWTLAAAEPITLDMTAGDAFDAVEDAVRGLRWHLVESISPGGRLGLGHLDAVAFSPVMHLPQDIAIRVTPLGGQSRVEVLSAARFGFTDLGEGAATIRQLADAIAAEADD